MTAEQNQPKSGIVHRPRFKTLDYAANLLLHLRTALPVSTIWRESASNIERATYWKQTLSIEDTRKLCSKFNTFKFTVDVSRPDITLLFGQGHLTCDIMLFLNTDIRTLAQGWNPDKPLDSFNEAAIELTTHIARCMVPFILHLRTKYGSKTLRELFLSDMAAELALFELLYADRNGMSLIDDVLDFYLDLEACKVNGMYVDGDWSTL
jgi:hypothetical protein